MKSLRKFLKAAAGADRAHDQPDGQRDGNTKNQEDDGQPVHKFYLSPAAQPDAAQCATCGGQVASGNAGTPRILPDRIIIRLRYWLPVRLG